MMERILVVDDEPDLQILITQRFRKQIREKEFEFVFAENGNAALDELAKNPNISLVLTDINMPEMDGLTLLDRMNKLDRIIKSVIVSAYGDMEKIRTAMNRGAFDFVTKPIDFADLQLTVGKAVLELAFIRSALEKDELLQIEKEGREMAQHREQVKQMFLANMSHEIRTPINAIYGMSQLLLKKERSTDDLTYLNAIKKSSENLIVIVNDILDLAKIEADKIVFEKIPFSVRECVELVKNTLQFKAEEKGLKFIIEINETTPPFVMGDPTRLSQILINLAGNAIKFTDKGEIKIHVNFKKEPSTNQVKMQFEVSDSGIGMSPDQLEKIFESFSQASADTTRKYGGTGLGLTIAKQFVELQGGTLKVSSELNRGTTFSFEIPYEVADDQNIAHEIEELTAKEIAAINNMKILMAEDNLFNQIVAEGLINSVAGEVKIEIVSNGKQALEKLNMNKFDVVLMDVRMPEMDGLETTAAIRKNEKIKSVPIIAMTAGTTEDEIKECFAVGMDEFVTKPFDVNDLFRKILKLTNSKNHL
ncbi:MAG: response regulator [Chitinophagales bacterium]